MITSKKLSIIIILSVICVITFQYTAYSYICNSQSERYPVKTNRQNSPGDTTYFIDPVNGDDTNSGIQIDQPWLTFRNVNFLLLAPGDRIEIIAPGEFNESLVPMGNGSLANPVVIHFAPGRYDFFPELAVKRKYHISNANDYPYDSKSIFLFFLNSTNYNVEGDDAWIYFRGMTIEACMDHSANIKFSGINFDYHRPTVSEFTVLSRSSTEAVIQIHPDSHYEIIQNSIVWIGEGWKYGWLYTKVIAQLLNPATGIVKRYNSPPLKTAISAVELEPYRVRVTYSGSNPIKKAGEIYQLRKPSRDYVGIFINRSKNVSFTNVGLHFLHGMGVISQFSEDLSFEDVTIAPRASSGRTCAAWADCLHFSGCRGKIRVIDTVFSGANDDAINVHGTHLIIVAKEATNKIKVCFMHDQTYGFYPFIEGDEIEYISPDSLCSYGSNVVTKVERLSDKLFLLTLEKSVPVNMVYGDAIENVTWTPEVEIRGCNVSLIPTRGFLLTTRRKVVIENNVFDHIYMHAILISDDSKKWYESGFVRDVTIRNNRFEECGRQNISIIPNERNGNNALPVHKNITVINNEFFLRDGEQVAIRFENTQGGTFSTNHVYTIRTSIDQVAKQDAYSFDIIMEGNVIHTQ